MTAYAALAAAVGAAGLVAFALGRGFRPTSRGVASPPYVRTSLCVLAALATAGWVAFACVPSQLGAGQVSGSSDPERMLVTGLRLFIDWNAPVILAAGMVLWVVMKTGRNEAPQFRRRRTSLATPILCASILHALFMGLALLLESVSSV